MAVSYICMYVRWKTTPSRSWEPSPPALAQKEFLAVAEGC